MKLILLEEVKENLPQGFEPYSIYSITVNNHEVGRLVLREGNDQQRYYDGHIAYTIDEEYRGHGYAYQACLLLKKIISKEHVLITCDPSNIASKKTIEKLGCQYIETGMIPKKYQKFFHQDEKVKMIYQWNLKEEKL